MSILERINADRRRYGIAPVKRSRILSAYARRHSAKMAEAHDLSHGDPAAFFARTGTFWRTYGENIGTTYAYIAESISPTERLHAAFMASPSHRVNILNPKFRRVGIGTYKAGDVLWITEAFWG